MHSVWIPLSSASSGSSGSFFVFSWVCVGDKKSRDTTIVDVQTFLEAFLNMSLRTAGFTDKGFFFGHKKKNFWSWDYSPQVPYYQDFQLLRCRIKGILLYNLHFLLQYFVQNNFHLIHTYTQKHMYVFCVS